MRLSNLKPANDYDVEKWLEESIDLTPYQKEKLRNDEIVRFSPFEFYEPRNTKNVSFLWRFTIIALPAYIIIMWAFMPIKMILTGKWYYNQKFIDKFHSVWMNKLNL